jgi:hypothetical protein
MLAASLAKGTGSFTAFASSPPRQANYLSVGRKIAYLANGFVALLILSSGFWVFFTRKSGKIGRRYLLSRLVFPGCISIDNGQPSYRGIFKPFEKDKKFSVCTL